MSKEIFQEDVQSIAAEATDFVANKLKEFGIVVSQKQENELFNGIANDVDAACLVGLSVEPILKGATAAAISGDYRGLEVKLSGDSTAAGHTVGGVTAGIMLYNTLKTGTYTGGVYPIVITASGDTQQWSGAFKIADVAGLTQAAAAGGTAHYIKIMIGSTACTITALSV